MISFFMVIFFIECDHSPCKNAGICRDKGYYAYSCLCRTGFVGKDCDRK